MRRRQPLQTLNGIELVEIRLQRLERDQPTDLGVQHDIVDKAGSWYSYGDDRIGQGKENVREFLKANPAMAEEIEGKIRALLLPKTVAAVDADDAEVIAKA